MTDKRLTILEELREGLLTQFRNAKGGVSASQVARELREVMAEIEELSGPREGSVSDEIKAKRERRLYFTAAPKN